MSFKRELKVYTGNWAFGEVLASNAIFRLKSLTLICNNATYVCFKILSVEHYHHQYAHDLIFSL